MYLTSRLLYLAIFIYYTALYMIIRCEALNLTSLYGKHIDLEKELAWTIKMSKPQIIEDQLLNECTGKFVKVHGKKVKASGIQSDPMTHFSMESLSLRSDLRMKAKLANKYICFNRQGRLKVKKNKKHAGCIFREHLVDGYSMYQSTWNKKWFIGFNKKGHPIKGTKVNSSRNKCFKFLKRNLHKHIEAHNKRHPGPPVDLSKAKIKHRHKKERKWRRRNR